MFRNILLSAFAAATLAGCATGYSYRNGNGGDYYYGQPRTEYRYYDYGAYGYYGHYGYGSYAPGYYYDRYGRLVYGTPYGYYGYPYSYGSRWGHRPRPQHDNDDDHEDGHEDGNDRRPPWRNIGAFPRDERAVPDREETRPRLRRQQLPATMPMPAPQREQRAISRPMPSMHSDGGGGSRMGRAVRNAKGSPATEE